MESFLSYLSWTFYDIPVFISLLLVLPLKGIIFQIFITYVHSIFFLGPLLCLVCKCFFFVWVDVLLHACIILMLFISLKKDLFSFASVRHIDNRQYLDMQGIHLQSPNWSGFYIKLCEILPQLAKSSSYFKTPKTLLSSIPFFDTGTPRKAQVALLKTRDVESRELNFLVILKSLSGINFMLLSLDRHPTPIKGFKRPLCRCWSRRFRDNIKLLRWRNLNHV